jgi:1-acyl-sn-glycerol-3-phosphate acyltransferase
MALRAGVPVVPCAMVGTFEIQPPGQVLPKIKRVTVRFGKPLDFSRYAGLENQKAAIRAITDEIMYAILELSGQEYVDRYAAEVKAEEQQREQEQRVARPTRFLRRRG